MHRANPEVPEIYLKPGELHLATKPTVLKTILGSCVGVTFWSPRLKVGALCHGILPASPDGTQPPEGYRYVDFAIDDLTSRFEALGANRAGLEIKVFGGADVLSRLAAGPQSPSVGQRNLEMAMSVLRSGKFNVIGCDVGGSAGRTMRFQTWDGHVFVRRHSGTADGCNGSCRSGKGCRFLEHAPTACAISQLLGGKQWGEPHEY